MSHCLLHMHSTSCVHKYVCVATGTIAGYVNLEVPSCVHTRRTSEMEVKNKGKTWQNKVSREL